MHRWICEMSVTQTSTSLCRELCWKRNLYHLKNIYTFLIWTIQSFYFFPSSTGIRIVCSKRNFITSSHCSHFVYDCIKSFAVAWQFSMNLSYELLHLKIFTQRPNTRFVSYLCDCQVNGKVDNVILNPNGYFRKRSRIKLYLHWDNNKHKM